MQHVQKSFPAWFDARLCLELLPLCASSFLGMRLPEIPAGHWQIADFGPQKLRPDVRGELVQFGLSIALLLAATKHGGIAK